MHFYDLKIINSMPSYNITSIKINKRTEFGSLLNVLHVLLSDIVMCTKNTCIILQR